MTETFYIDSDLPGSKANLFAFIGSRRGKWKIECAEQKRGRSLKANAYFHAVIVPAYIAYEKDQGNFYTPEQAFELLKRYVLPVDYVNRKTGAVEQIGGSSSKLSVEEFSEFTERATVFLAELGVVLPTLEMMR